jgi:hypothetical protein
MGLIVSRPLAASPLDAERVNGSYTLKDGRRSGTMELELVAPDKIHVGLEVFLFEGVGLGASGSGEGDAVVEGERASANFKTQWATGPCSISLHFEPGNTVEVSQQGDSGDCGFGNHVLADGSYHKARGGKPKRSPVPNPDAHALAAVVAEADTELASLPVLVQKKRPSIDALAAERKTLSSALPQQERDFEHQARVATTAINRYTTSNAAQKPPLEPSLAELLSVAQTETPPAVRLGRELVKSNLRLRELEDQLVQLVAEANQAATDAKLALADRRKATAALGALSKKAGFIADPTALAAAKKSDADASARATATAAAATSARTAARISPATYATLRSKAEHAIQTRLAQIEALEHALEGLEPTAPAPAGCEAPR